MFLNDISRSKHVLPVSGQVRPASKVLKKHNSNKNLFHVYEFDNNSESSVFERKTNIHTEGVVYLTES